MSPDFESLGFNSSSRDGFDLVRVRSSKVLERRRTEAWRGVLLGPGGGEGGCRFFWSSELKERELEDEELPDDKLREEVCLC